MNTIHLLHAIGQGILLFILAFVLIAAFALLAELPRDKAWPAVTKLAALAGFGAFLLNL